MLTDGFQITCFYFVKKNDTCILVEGICSDFKKLYIHQTLEVKGLSNYERRHLACLVKD